MKPTLYQDRLFTESIVESLLEKAIEWISVNLNPDDVFDEEVLRGWAENRGYIGEGDLDQWAKDNGYVYGEEE